MQQSGRWYSCIQQLSGSTVCGVIRYIYVFVYLVPSKWIKQRTNICCGTMNDDYATFQFKHNCSLVAVRLMHVSGSIHCAHGESYASRWGGGGGGVCNGNPPKFGTIIAKHKGAITIPEEEEVDMFGSYDLDGFTVHDDVILFRIKTVNVMEGEEYQIWFGMEKILKICRKAILVASIVLMWIFHV